MSEPFRKNALAQVIVTAISVLSAISAATDVHDRFGVRPEWMWFVTVVGLLYVVWNVSVRLARLETAIDPQAVVRLQARLETLENVPRSGPASPTEAEIRKELFSHAEALTHLISSAHENRTGDFGVWIRTVTPHMEAVRALAPHLRPAERALLHSPRGIPKRAPLGAFDSSFRTIYAEAALMQQGLMEMSEAVVQQIEDLRKAREGK